MSRNSLAVFDPALAREQSQAELRSKAAPKKIHEVNKIGTQKFGARARTFARLRRQHEACATTWRCARARRDIR